MKIRNLYSTSAIYCRNFVANLRHNAEGVAALEFALVAPILLMLFLGSVEFSQALTLDRRVTSVASSTADLVAQSESVSTADLADIIQLANDIIESALVMNFEPNLFEVKLVSVVTDDEGVATVDWSYQNGGSEPYPNGSSYANLPTGLLGPLESVVISEVKYAFNPEIGKFLVGGVNLEETSYLRPRRSLSVTKTN